MASKGLFFDLFNRRKGVSFEDFLQSHERNRDYIEFRDAVIPTHYGDAEEEYQAIRNSAAMFDISANIKFRVRGREASDYLDYLLTRPASTVAPSRVFYSVICNDHGHVRDDVIVYKMAQDDYLILPALEDGSYLETVRQRSGLRDLSVEDCSDALSGIALQGPLSAALLQACGCADVEMLKPFDSREYSIAGARVMVARMGFTGDLGYELWFPPLCGEQVGAAITAAGVALGIAVPGYGLVAVETCRIEGGLIVPGRDFATDRVPNPGFERFPSELNLDWLVRFDGRAFVGRDALMEASNKGPRYSLRSFTLDGAARPGPHAEIRIDGEDGEHIIGRVTSSCWSWSLGTVIGHASIERGYAHLETAHLLIDGKRVGLRMSHGPLLNLPRRTRVPAPLLS